VILGIGLDLCEVERVRRLLEKDHDRFVRRVFRPSEIAYCEDRRRPEQHYAARFAAKEAFLKALGRGWRLGWTQLEVVRSASGKPGLTLHGKAREAASRRGVRQAHLTLTHSLDTAAAVVILEGGEEAGEEA
jgi:holo-[acyl-carrier protein] synthase